MQNITLFKKITNLSNEKVTFTKIEKEDKKIIITIRWKYSTSICPYCGLKTSKRKDRELHEQKNNLKHMPYWWDQIIEFKTLKRCFRCIKCKKSFYERFAFESKLWNYTTHFEKYIQWNWWFVSWNKIY